MGKRNGWQSQAETRGELTRPPSQTRLVAHSACEVLVQYPETPPIGVADLSQAGQTRQPTSLPRWPSSKRTESSGSIERTLDHDFHVWLDELASQGVITDAEAGDVNLPGTEPDSGDLVQRPTTK